jgi:hypothetical protein
MVAAASIVSAAASHPPIRTLLNSPLGAPPAFIKPTAAPGPQDNTSKLARGKVLVAARDLIDPNFAETVVLLLAYELLSSEERNQMDPRNLTTGGGLPRHFFFVSSFFVALIFVSFSSSAASIS